MEDNQEKIGVVLLNLGGPERTQDVRQFLFNLFSDRQIIRLGPAFMQKPIAWWIAFRRAPKSQGYYQLIGGGSPLNRITSEQGAALEKSLSAHGLFKVGMVMRYWHPFVDEIMPSFVGAGYTKIVALTLYPHYSIATTGSSIADLNQYVEKMSNPPEIIEVDAWPDQPDYVSCLATRIQNGVQHDLPTEVVYSAHSLPVKFIQEGDPYLDHLNKTIQAVEEITGTKGHLCFQSRSGPVEWLAPSTPDTLEELSKKGCRRVLIVPISFVSDHVETLYEIDIQYKELIEDFGMEFARIPSLNDDPKFICGLGKLVVDACRSKNWIE